MKTFICFLLMQLITLCLFGQAPDFKLYEDKTKDLLESYKTGSNEAQNNKVIDNLLLTENIEKAFSYVILSNSDLVTNSSAFGYTQGKDETSIASSANFKLEKLNNSYLRFGVNATGQDNIFEIYSDNSWNSNVGGNIGFVWRIKGSTVNYLGKDAASLKKKRKVFAYEPIRNKDRFLKTFKDTIDFLLIEIEEGKFDKGIMIDYKTIFDEYPNLTALYKAEKFIELYDFLNAEKKRKFRFF